MSATNNFRDGCVNAPAATSGTSGEPLIVDRLQFPTYFFPNERLHTIGSIFKDSQNTQKCEIKRLQDSRKLYLSFDRTIKDIENNDTRTRKSLREASEKLERLQFEQKGTQSAVIEYLGGDFSFIRLMKLKNLGPIAERIKELIAEIEKLNSIRLPRIPKTNEDARPMYVLHWSKGKWLIRALTLTETGAVHETVDAAEIRQNEAKLFEALKSDRLKILRKELEFEKIRSKIWCELKSYRKRIFNLSRIVGDLELKLKKLRRQLKQATASQPEDINLTLIRNRRDGIKRLKAALESVAEYTMINQFVEFAEAYARANPSDRDIADAVECVLSQAEYERNLRHNNILAARTRYCDRRDYYIFE